MSGTAQLRRASPSALTPDELSRRLRLAEAELAREVARRTDAEAKLSHVVRLGIENMEADRRRIARDLHDSMGQSVALLQLGLAALGQAARPSPEVDESGIAGRVSALSEIARGLGEELHRIAWSVRPPCLDGLGLDAAIRQAMEAWSEASGISIDLHLGLAGRPLATAVETTLFRVLQEALTNIARHAAARHVGVMLRTTPGRVSLIVEDDGSGIDWLRQPRERACGRLGVTGIRERLALVDGTIELEAEAGRGTTLYIHIPV